MKTKKARWREEKTAGCTMKWFQSMERLLKHSTADLENEILKHFANHGARKDLMKLS